jgi:hypothetical protein
MLSLPLLPFQLLLIKQVATVKFILPCVENALVDSEEAVISGAVRCLATLTQLHLLTGHTLLEQIAATATLLQHPSLAIRYVVHYLALL